MHFYSMEKSSFFFFEKVEGHELAVDERIQFKENEGVDQCECIISASLYV